MKKTTNSIICIVVALFVCLGMISCSNKPFENTISGYAFDLNNESVFKIEQTCEFGQEKNGYIESADIDISVKGYSELSYFDAVITFIWTYEFLNDEGEFEEAEFVATVELDANGCGNYNMTEKLEGCRSYRNLALYLEFGGYAVKK